LIYVKSLAAAAATGFVDKYYSAVDSNKILQVFIGGVIYSMFKVYLNSGPNTIDFTNC
jgi:hypothetical protein